MKDKAKMISPPSAFGYDSDKLEQQEVFVRERLGAGSVYSPVRCPTCKHTLKSERHSFPLKAVRRWGSQQMKRTSACQLGALECGLVLCACLTDTFEELQVITASPRSHHRRRNFPAKQRFWCRPPAEEWGFLKSPQQAVTELGVFVGLTQRRVKDAAGLSLFWSRYGALAVNM